MENCNFCIGDSSSNGGFPIAMLVYRSVTHNNSEGFSMGQRFSESVDGRLTTEHVPPRLLRLTRHKAWNAARVEVLEDGFIKDQGNLHEKGGIYCISTLLKANKNPLKQRNLASFFDLGSAFFTVQKKNTK